MLKPKFMAACFVQCIALVVGVISFAVFLIASSYLITFIASLPIIGSLLYYPSTPMLYILTGSALLSVYPSMIICKKMCEKSDLKYNIALAVLGFLILAYSAYAIWFETRLDGFSFDVIFGYLSMAALAVIFGIKIKANEVIEV